ncbi:MAG: DNA polymerase ligase N-terminal domain-containing protein [Desulfobacteraceae bacterium]
MTASPPKYLIHHHLSRHPHFDLRLEVEGVLKSWAVPKEPSLDPKVKRLALEVEDHPLAYADFEGFIPEGQYGAGQVYLWDQGTYENLLAQKPNPQTMSEALAQGRVEVRLSGRRRQGNFALIRLKGKPNQWLFFKIRD